MPSSRPISSAFRSRIVGDFTGRSEVLVLPGVSNLYIRFSPFPSLFVHTHRPRLLQPLARERDSFPTHAKQAKQKGLSLVDRFQ